MYYVSCQYLVLLLVCSVNKISAYRYAFIIAIAYIYIYTNIYLNLHQSGFSTIISSQELPKFQFAGRHRVWKAGGETFLVVQQTFRGKQGSTEHLVSNMCNSEWWFVLVLGFRMVSYYCSGCCRYEPWYVLGWNWFYWGNDGKCIW